jgi:integrase
VRRFTPPFHCGATRKGALPVTYFSYLTRRSGGVYYLQIRVPKLFGQSSKLWRFSLFVRDYRSARRAVLPYLSWLLPMKDANETTELVEILCDRLDRFLIQPRAADANDVRHRIHFLNRLLQYVTEWKTADLSPVQDRMIEEHFFRLRDGAVILNVGLLDDMVTWGVYNFSQNALANWESSYAWDFDEIPPPPDDPIPLPGDRAHAHAVGYAISSASEPELIRKYFSKYRPDWLRYLSSDGQTVVVGTGETAAKPLTESYTAAAAQTFVDFQQRDLERLSAAHPTADRTGRGVASQPAAKLAQAGSLTLMKAKKAYLDFRCTEQGDRRNEEDAGLVIDFMIDFLGDVPLSALTPEQLLEFEHAMASVPDRKNLPKEATRSLFARYQYAQEHGFDGLKPMSITRIRNVWHRSLHQFFNWLSGKGFYSGHKHKFSLVPKNAIEPQQRDAWTDDELLKLFSLPLFTGAESAEHFWTKGDVFVQNELYWAYLIIFFCGMRNSEIGTLRVADIVIRDGIEFFDLHVEKTAPKGERVERKTKSSERYVPIPRLLIDLGLLDRKADLEAAGIETLFPEWRPYKHPQSGRAMPGHHFSKSWQYLKDKCEFRRGGLTLYGGRHTRAGWYDEANLPARVRNRVLGHAATNVPEGYGPTDLTTREAQMVLAVTPQIEHKIAEILLTAKLRAAYGELKVVKTWIKGEPPKAPPVKVRSSSPQSAKELASNRHTTPIDETQSSLRPAAHAARGAEG